MSFLPMLMTMLKLFLIVLVGFICHRARVFPEQTQAALTKVVMYVSAPCTIIYGVTSCQTAPSVRTTVTLLLLSFGCYAVLLLLSWPLVRLMRVSKGQRGVFTTLLVFSNCLFVGMPVVQSIFGSEALYDLVVFSIPFNPCIYIIGVYLILRDARHLHGEQSRGASLRLSTFISPCLVASILAIILSLSTFSLPAVLEDTMSLLAGITTPGALLVIGISIGKAPLRSMLGSPKIYLMCAMRLLVFPTLLWLLLRLILQDPIALGVSVVVSALPSAATIPMLATEYDGDVNVAVQGVCLSTLLSMVTIPLLVSLLIPAV